MLHGKFKGTELELAGFDTFKYIKINEQKINVDNILYFKVTKRRTSGETRGFLLGH